MAAATKNRFLRLVILAALLSYGSQGSAHIAHKIALTGDVNPQGGTFNNFGQVVLNNFGQVAFVGDEIGGSLPTLYLYDHNQGTLSVVYEFGSPLFTTCGVAVNDRGDVAFGRASPTSLVVWNSGEMNEVARIADDTPVGGSFTGFGCLPLAGRRALNNAGELVFVAWFVSSEGSNTHGIFAGTGTSTRAIVVVGDSAPTLCDNVRETGRPIEFNVEGGGVTFHDPLSQTNAG